MSFFEQVEFNGSIIPSLNGKAQISLPVQGLVSKIVCNNGQHVGKGQVLVEISGNELIDIQRDYAESSANILRLYSEYQRINDLFNEKIGSKKELILAESAYKSEMARNKALKIKLERIGLDVAKIEEGSFYEAYAVKTPLDGYVTNINATVGQYIEQQQVIAEVIDISKFQLKLAVFEKDIPKLRNNQQVFFYFVGDRNKTFRARIRSVGRTINPDSKAIDCYADIEDLKAIRMVSNQFAEGYIVVDSFNVYALPAEAIMQSGNEDFVLNLEKETEAAYYFNKIKVIVKRKNNDHVELTEKPKGNKILIQGAYNLQVE
jgi:cobalt-zinc-cadmium efflux system membrane fusion protein